MIYYIIPTIIIILSFLTIIFIIVRKFPDLAVINVESIAQEKEIKVKNRLLQDRLKRKFFSLKKFLSVFFSPLKKSISDTSTKVYKKTIELEKKSLKQAQGTKAGNGKDSKTIASKLELASRNLADQNFDKAEELCVLVIDSEPQNLDAYGILVKIYLEQKEYKKAKETCRYLIKLLTRMQGKTEFDGDKRHLANCYADLGLVYQLENKNNHALTNFQKAVSLEPNNPRFLDFLLKISIILKNKKLAEKAFSSLRKADSQNQKLAELKEEIDNLPS